MKADSMDGYLSSVWYRLNNGGHRLSPEQFQLEVKRDLDALLNTRSAVQEDMLAAFPHCRDSILTFGLSDFAQMCLSNSADRKEICRRLKTSLERHEPRLSKVQVNLVPEAGAINRLSFVISARLPALAAAGRFQFNIMLEPSSLHYSVR